MFARWYKRVECCQISHISLPSMSWIAVVALFSLFHIAAAQPPTCSYEKLLFFAEYVPRREQDEYVPYYVAKNISRVEACAKFCHETYFCNVALYEPESQRCQIVYPKEKKCYLFSTRYRRYNPFGATLIQCISCGDYDYRGRRFSLPNGGFGGKGLGEIAGGRHPGGRYGESSSYNAAGDPSNIGACVPNLCLNGGSILLYHDNTYECVCPSGFIGRLCEDKEQSRELAGHLMSRHDQVMADIMRPCKSNPCHNGGVCLPGAMHRHFCICKPSFTGPKCQFLTQYSSNNR